MKPIDKMTFEEIENAWREMIDYEEDVEDFLYTVRSIECEGRKVDDVLNKMEAYSGMNAIILEVNYGGKIDLSVPRPIKQVRKAFKKAWKEHEKQLAGQNKDDEERRLYNKLKAKYEPAVRDLGYSWPARIRMMRSVGCIIN